MENKKTCDCCGDCKTCECDKYYNTEKELNELFKQIKIKPFGYMKRTKLEDGGYLLEVSETKDGPIVVKQYFNADGELHREDAPAYEQFREDGTKFAVMYYNEDIFENENGPTVEFYDEKEQVKASLYMEDEKTPHNENGPAVIMYKDGKVKVKQYYKHGKLHNLVKPAHIEFNEDGVRVLESYHENGVYSRENKPSLIIYFDNGKVKKEHYIEKKYLSRLDGPAYLEYDEDGNIIDKKYVVKGFEFKNKKDFLENKDKPMKAVEEVEKVYKEVSSLLESSGKELKNVFDKMFKK